MIWTKLALLVGVVYLLVKYKWAEQVSSVISEAERIAYQHSQ